MVGFFLRQRIRQNISDSNSGSHHIVHCAERLTTLPVNLFICSILNRVIKLPLNFKLKLLFFNACEILSMKNPEKAVVLSSLTPGKLGFKSWHVL